MISVNLFSNQTLRIQPGVLDVRKRPWPPCGRLPLGKRPASGQRTLGEKFTRHFAQRHVDLRHPPIRAAERLRLQPHSSHPLRGEEAIKIHDFSKTKNPCCFLSMGREEQFWVVADMGLTGESWSQLREQINFLPHFLLGERQNTCF